MMKMNHGHAWAAIHVFALIMVMLCLRASALTSDSWANWYYADSTQNTYGKWRYYNINIGTRPRGSFSGYISIGGRRGMGADYSGYTDKTYSGRMVVPAKLDHDVLEVMWNTFNSCSKIKEVVFSEGIEVVETDFLDCTALTNVVFATSIEKASLDFSRCTALRTITFPSTIKKMECPIFSGCNKLSNVTFRCQIKDIKAIAFRGCSALANLSVPNGITNIEYYAFENCTSLTGLDLRNTALKNMQTDYRWSPFSGCSSLKYVRFPNLSTLAFQFPSTCTGIKWLSFNSAKKLVKHDGLPSNLKFIFAKGTEPAHGSPDLLSGSASDLTVYVAGNSNWKCKTSSGVKMWPATQTVSRVYCRWNTSDIKTNENALTMSKTNIGSGRHRISISTTLNPAVVFYSLDGSEPTWESNVYQGAIEISGETVVKAVAIGTNGNIAVGRSLSECDAVTVQDARQRYPWNGMVDFSFTIEGTSGVKYATSFSAKDVVGGTNVVMRTVRKSDGTAANVSNEQLLPGTYNWVWDAAADLPRGWNRERVTISISSSTSTSPSAEFKVDLRGMGPWEMRTAAASEAIAYSSTWATNAMSGANAVVKVWPVKKEKPKYIAIDLSGGTAATHYPIECFDEIPGGSWSDEYKTSKLVLRHIPAGSFIMGGRNTDYPGAVNTNLHMVTITKDFYMGVFEVTQRQWELVMGNRPSAFTNESCYATRPVEYVSHDDMRGAVRGRGWPDSKDVDGHSFIGMVRRKSGLTGFDLPTEAQWEYACRAGTATALNSGKNITDSLSTCPNIEEVARYLCNSAVNLVEANITRFLGFGLEVGTTEVGSYLPNNWGLYDMHGNVWE